MYDIVIGRNEKDREKYGLEGTFLLAKHYVKMGQTTSLSNKVYMDITRSHIVFVCGKRGCLTEDTFVLTDSGYKKIVDFDEQKDAIYSYNRDMKEFGWEKNVQLLSYDISKKEELYEVLLEDGQKLTMTSEHPLLVLDGKKHVWKIAADISTKDIIVSLHSISDKVKKSKYSLRLARILGCLLADGTMQTRKGRFIDGRGHPYNGTKSRLRIVNTCDSLLKQVKIDIEKEFGVACHRYKKGQENCDVVECRHQQVISKLSTFGVPLGKKSDIIRVPDIVWESSLSFKREFLKALFSCDGFVDKTGTKVVYYSNSRAMLTDLQLILGYFSIQSRVRVKNVTCNGKKFISYQLDISDYTSVKNFGNIGFFQEEKCSRIDNRKFHRMHRRKSTVYFNTACFGQKVVSVTKSKGHSKVYDLRVPINHSFVANGVVSHNSGKSYSLGVIAEGLIDLPPEIRRNLSIILVDTMGIYWTMKYPNKKDGPLLKTWGLEAKGLDIKIYTPKDFYEKYKVKGIPTDVPFSIRTSELNGSDWCLAFDVDENDRYGVLIDKVINELQDKLADDSIEYDLDMIISKLNEITDVEGYVKAAVINKFTNAKKWGLFSTDGTKLTDLVKGGQVTVLDVSPYATIPNGWNIKSLVLGLVSQKLFNQRMKARKDEEYDEVQSTVHFFSDDPKQKQTDPLVWLVIDEAHEFLPKEGKTSASDPLITILREGRQPGISLVLATQQPGKIHTDVMTQSDTVFAHRLTAKIDVDALSTLMQSYMRTGLDQALDNLPRVQGAGVIFDDSNEKMYPIRVRPRFTWHGGESPTAMSKKKKLGDF